MSDKKIEYEYSQKAIQLLSESKTATHVVYGLKYYKPDKDDYTVVHTEFFLDACDDKRFQRIYQTPSATTPLIFVYAVHK